MAKKVPYYSPDRKIYPMTKTDYVKRGSRWVEVNKETELISLNQTKNVLNKRGLPFERSHRLEKRDKYRHFKPYDTFSSISPDGQNKSTWYVDWVKGDDNYRRLQYQSVGAKQAWRKRKGNK